MKVLIVADSAYGNTWAVAGAIAEGFGGDALALRPEHVGPDDVRGLDLLFVGSPTQGGRPLAAVQAFVTGLPKDGLAGVDVGAFDTRVDAGAQSLPLRLLVNVIGYAAPKIGKALSARGGRLIAPPEGFMVEGKEGPLRAGELERAAGWARSLRTATVR